MSNKFLILLVSIFSLRSVESNASLIKQFINDTIISGDLRTYEFNREYSKVPSQNAVSFGGGLNILTGELLPGLRFDGELYTAQPFGLNSDERNRVDNTLPGYALTTLGQSYLQYQHANLLLQGGNQLLNTPWINSTDSRMIPATYQAVYGQTLLFQHFTVTLLRSFRYKGRSENGFTKTNLYNTNNIGGTNITAFGNTPDNGALSFGVNYQLNNLAAQAWYYQFYDFSQLFYADTRYNFNNFFNLKPFLSAQILQEIGSGKNLLSDYEGGNANAVAFGSNLGINFWDITTSIAYNYIPQQENAFKYGDILSPYTSGYADDPLYTTSMIAGLVEKSSGHAVKLTATFNLLNSTLLFSSSYAKYFTRPYLANTSEIDADLTYNFSQRLKDCSIRYRIGILNGNSSTGRFVYNRIMLQYIF